MRSIVADIYVFYSLYTLRNFFNDLRLQTNTETPKAKLH